MIPAPVTASLPANTPQSLARIRTLEAELLKMPQSQYETQHVLHGGMYARTIMVPAGDIMTGALIKIATVLIVSGDCLVTTGDTTVPMLGYNVLTGSAGRKQAFLAITDVYMTMLFPTSAKTVAECEEQFTDEYATLMSRHCENDVRITGE